MTNASDDDHPIPAASEKSRAHFTDTINGILLKYRDEMREFASFPGRWGGDGEEIDWGKMEKGEKGAFLAAGADFLLKVNRAKGIEGLKNVADMFDKWIHNGCKGRFPLQGELLGYYQDAMSDGSNAVTGYKVPWEDGSLPELHTKLLKRKHRLPKLLAATAITGAIAFASNRELKKRDQHPTPLADKNVPHQIDSSSRASSPPRELMDNDGLSEMLLASTLLAFLSGFVASYYWGSGEWDSEKSTLPRLTEKLKEGVAGIATIMQHSGIDKILHEQGREKRGM